MAGIGFDTSGEVAFPAIIERTGDRDTISMSYRWSDLSPFEQGYVEALFASAVLPGIRRTHVPTGEVRPATLASLKLGFSDLSPEALEAIRRDCGVFQREAWQPCLNAAGNNEPYMAARVKKAGGDFWCARNGRGEGYGDGWWLSPAAEHLTAAALTFPPLTVFLGDDGKIHLSEARS